MVKAFLETLGSYLLEIRSPCLPRMGEMSDFILFFLSFWVPFDSTWLEVLINSCLIDKKCVHVRDIARWRKRREMLKGKAS